MSSIFQRLAKILPALFTALLLAVAVWISAVSANDPTEENAYPRTVPIEVIGQDANLVLMNNPSSGISVRIRAPQSIWATLRTDQTSVRAIIDLSGLEVGTHTVPVQVQVSARPAEIVSYSPRTVNVILERLVSRTLPVELVTRGELSVGFQAEEPILEQDTVTISGPQSLVDQVQRVRAILDLSDAEESIDRTLTLQAVDGNDVVVNDVSLSPDRVRVTEVITQRFGYRNVVVKAEVTGQVANGYRLTNISVFPPAVTVYSSNAQVVSNLPGYISTLPLDLTNVRDDVDISVLLDLPDGVSVVGDQTEVLVRVGIAAIESSLTLDSIPVEVVGLPAEAQAEVQPETVTVIFSGPLALLEQLTLSNTRVYVDVTGFAAGTYQVEPQVEIIIKDVSVESILPNTIQVVISPAATGTGNR